MRLIEGQVFVIITPAADRVNGHARRCARERACPKLNVYGYVHRVSLFPLIITALLIIKCVCINTPLPALCSLRSEPHDWGK